MGQRCPFSSLVKESQSIRYSITQIHCIPYVIKVTRLQISLIYQLLSHLDRVHRGGCLSATQQAINMIAVRNQQRAHMLLGLYSVVLSALNSQCSHYKSTGLISAT